jgi:hypothetical protein
MSKLHRPRFDSSGIVAAVARTRDAAERLLANARFETPAGFVSHTRAWQGRT